jgi:hypothetical protein
MKNVTNKTLNNFMIQKDYFYDELYELVDSNNNRLFFDFSLAASGYVLEEKDDVVLLKSSNSNDNSYSYTVTKIGDLCFVPVPIIPVMRDAKVVEFDSFDGELSKNNFMKIFALDNQNNIFNKLNCNRIIVKDISLNNKKGDVFVVKRNNLCNWLSNSIYADSEFMLFQIYEILHERYKDEAQAQQNYDESDKFKLKILFRKFYNDIVNEYRIYFFTNKDNNIEIMRIAEVPNSLKENYDVKKISSEIFIDKIEQFAKQYFVDNKNKLFKNKYLSGTLDLMFIDNGNKQCFEVLETHLMSGVGFDGYKSLRTYDSFTLENLLLAFKQSYM